MSSQLSLMSLFEVGTHRGNKKSKLNPKFKKRIYGFSNGLSLINLVETNNYLENAAELMKKLGQKKKQILIVGTSKHLQALVPEFAEKFANGPMPYIDNRWLGGTLTNWSTVKKTLKTLEKYGNIISNKEFFSKLTRNEQLNLTRKHAKINRFFKGLVNLKTNKPGAILVLDTANNPIAIQEADASGVPVVALSNTSSLVVSSDLKYTVVCNNNSLNSIKLIVDHLTKSYNEGLNSGVVQVVSEKEKVPAMA